MQVNQCGNGQGVNFQGFVKLGRVKQILPEIPSDSKFLENFRVNTKSIDNFYNRTDDGISQTGKTILELSNGKVIEVKTTTEELERAIMKADNPDPSWAAIV